VARTKFASEKAVQNWVAGRVAAGTLRDAIDGAERVETALAQSASPNFWPMFPIDYLSRKCNLRAARAVLDSLSALTLITKNSIKLSQTAGPALFADLLYCAEKTSQFVLFEIKNRKAGVRETVTQLLAYEHEIFNHLPLAGHDDVRMVVVSRDFTTLLDHALTGLNTWSRRQVLCLRFDDTRAEPRLVVHIPRAWKAIGQTTLSGESVCTAHLSFQPRADMTIEQIHAVCDTAAALMVREAERRGGSGFVMIVEDCFYPAITTSPFEIFAGVVNPFSFLPAAKTMGFVDASSSALSKYVLDGGVLGDLSIGWNWVSSDGDAAIEYLGAFGTPIWNGFSNWNAFRDVHRWRSVEVTPDRHLMPVSIDFWGILGDYIRDAVRQTSRMQTFMPAYAKPGFDWRHPVLGVALLDDISLTPVVQQGQWQFSTIFAFGVRLGRLTDLTAHYADGDDETRRKMQAEVFWAEVDIIPILYEVLWRYRSASDLTGAPPTIPIGLYDNSKNIAVGVAAFTKWFVEVFIGERQALMQHAFITGLRIHSLFDARFDTLPSDDPTALAIREEAIAAGRDWLKWTAAATISGHADAATVGDEMAAAFGGAIPLNQKKNAVFKAIDALDDAVIIEKPLIEIPRLMDLWHSMLVHTLEPFSPTNLDWDWFEDQVRAARERNVQHPCIRLTPDGRFGVSKLGPDTPPPLRIANPETEVLLWVTEQSGLEVVVRVTWEGLRMGKVAGGLVRAQAARSRRRS